MTAEGREKTWDTIFLPGRRMYEDESGAVVGSLNE